MSSSKSLFTSVLTLVLFINPSFISAQKITIDGKPGKLEIREAASNTVRITLKPLDYSKGLPYTPALAERVYGKPVIVLEEISEPVRKSIAGLHITVAPDPLRITITNAAGDKVQEIIFNDALPHPCRGWAPGFWQTKSRPMIGIVDTFRPGEILDSSHIQNYWKQHVGLIEKGIDGFWPDEGDWFNLFERIKRHQMYYQGPLTTVESTRPWSLHRNGHLGIAQWGGWVWSGDTESSWKTLEGQIAVGINHSLSIGPYWGSDIGGFYPNNEKTGELYARWFQFGAFCGSFRSHGRTWFTALPWGWGLPDMGPREDDNRNIPAPDTDRRNPLVSEMNNPAIEPIIRKYDELRYMLLPYTYTLAWEAYADGMPLMRAMWLQYPEDERAADIGDQYMWGSERPNNHKDLSWC